MNKLMRLTKIIFLAITLLSTISCVDDDDNGNIIDNSIPNNIIDFITNNEEYSTLLAAVNQTGLTATLASPGPFTLFAPNNEAFEAFLGETALEDMDNEVLTQVLLNHVLNFSVESDNLSSGYIKNLAIETTTEASLDMYIDTSSGILINGISTVTTPDIAVDNGTIHTVSTVIDLPNITTFIMADPNFSSLATVLTADDSFTYIETLQNSTNTAPAPFTLFAPDNNAFTSLLTDLDIENISEIDINTLETILDLHIVEEGIIRAESFIEFEGEGIVTSGGAVVTVLENLLTVIGPDGEENLISLTDTQAVNGVIHTLGRVMR